MSNYVSSLPEALTRLQTRGLVIRYPVRTCQWPEGCTEPTFQPLCRRHWGRFLDLEARDLYFPRTPSDGRLLPHPSGTPRCYAGVGSRQTPRPILTLMTQAAKWLREQGMTKMRGQWKESLGVWVMPIFHPSYLLRNPSRNPGSPKSLMWEDIREVRKKYNELI